MRTPVILITPDEALARAVAALLTAHPGIALQPSAAPPAARTGLALDSPELFLVDDRLWRPAPAAGPPWWREWRQVALPPTLVLLGDESELALAAVSAGIADFIHRSHGMHQLRYVVQEQAALCQRRRRQYRGEHAPTTAWPPAGDSLRHQLNNPLAGILGHAELALGQGALPADLRRRLEWISALAAEMRDLLQAPAEVG